ncbi:MAG: DUF488 domain-containing protein [Rhodospirillales bacterium]|jgi:uncharacterized protein (DUF488 family)|nr:DUF488 domain-containing protein [Rhodospirillales bacterium]
MATRIYTIGHSNRTADALAALLAANGVDLVADVRRFPRSRRNPQFNIEALPTVLAGHGIGYRHMESLGGRRPGIAVAASPNAGWREPGFRTFADYALTPPFRSGLADLLGLAEGATPAVMCAEALWWQCHRRIIADYLLAAGAEVWHILGDAPPRPAALTPGALAGEDGTVRYPPAEPTLF